MDSPYTRRLGRTGALSRALAIVLLAPAAVGPAVPNPITPEQARTAVTNWLAADGNPLGAAVGSQVGEVRACADGKGCALCYVMFLQPNGFVIVGPDDLIEPIVGFATGSEFDPSADTPLGRLVINDLSARVAEVKQLGGKPNRPALGQGEEDRFAEARAKWSKLLLGAQFDRRQVGGVGSVSDPRVPPLMQSRWSQSTECGSACYNYYVPPGPDGSSSNYPCGCVATAMAQLMRFHQHPTASVGSGRCFTIYVNEASQQRCLRGGDGSGGAYNWADMVLDPNCATTLAQRQAIGALTHDAGVSVGMDYLPGGSGADTLTIASRLKDTFGYASAVRARMSDYSSIPLDTLEQMVNPNLDAGLPALFGITGSPGGHAIVCDGYGYNAGTMYHHLNMGWAGQSDQWYNLPNIDSSPGPYSTIYKCVYNVYVSGTGEIISGRVTDELGNPLENVLVTAQRVGGGTYTATTNSRGIYGIPRVPANSTYTMTAQKPGHSFVPQTAITGASTDNSGACGNVWGIDWPVQQLTCDASFEDGVLPAGWTAGGSASWQVTSSGHDGIYCARAGTITHNQSTYLRATVNCGAGSVKFWKKVSSESGYDYLRFRIDGNQVASWSGCATTWSRASFEVGAGIHTFEWSYTKDGSVSSCSDTAWIDCIDFPDCPTPSAPILEPKPRYTQGTTNLVRWQPAADSAEHLLEWDNDSAFASPDGNSGWIGAAEFAASGLVDGRTYYYRAKSRNSCGESGWSNVVSSTQDATPPSISVSPAAGEHFLAYGQCVVLQFSAQDPCSGVSNCSGILDGAPAASGVRLTALGAHRLAVTAVDQAGNSAQRTIEYKLVPSPTDTISIFSATEGRSTDPAHQSCAGYNLGAAFDPISATPASLVIDPGDKWCNFTGAWWAGLSYTLKSVCLSKSEPDFDRCPTFYPGRSVLQRGSGSIRHWWPLMYELPGTSWTLTLFYHTPQAWDDDGPGPNRPLTLHKGVYTWTVDASPDSVIRTLDVFHQLPFGAGQTPLIGSDALYAELRRKALDLKAGIGSQDWGGALRALYDYEMLVVESCVTAIPPEPLPSGQTIGIANTWENPVCCKLLADMEYVGSKYGVLMPSK